MAYSISLPPTLRGTEKEKLERVYRHLYKLSNELNTVINQVSRNAAEEAVAAVVTTTVESTGSVVDEKITSAYQVLRSLIIKESETVNATMDEIRETLTSDYVAQSEFGAFQSTLTNTIQTTAEGILQSFQYDERLDAIDDDMAGFQSYQATTEQYVKVGVVKYNDDGTAEAGVVVGKNLQEVEVDGETIITTTDMYSCFTAERLSFWKNGVEQAYISNETLYVTNISATDHIELGTGENKWRIDTTNGFTIRNVG